MSIEQATQSGGGPRHLGPSPGDSHDRDRQLGDPLSPYLTSKEAAQYLRFTDARFLLRWAKRSGIRPSRRGRVLLWERRYLDAVVAPSSVGLRSQRRR